MIAARNRWYRDALAGSHEAYSRVEVWRQGVQVEELAWRARGSQVYNLAMPVFYGGSLRATLTSRITRQLTLSVPDYLFPWRATDLLNPYGQELRAFHGIRYGNSSPDEFPIFTGTIVSATPPKNGEVTIEASDNSFRVAGAGFASPVPSQTATPLVREFERLVRGAYPQAVFGTHSPITNRTPALAYDQDRGSALDGLAKAANAFWYTLANGAYVLRRVPWSVRPSTAPLALQDGPGGTLMTAFPNRNANGLYNRVTVVSDRSDGGTPLAAFAEDTDPASPTYVGGPFGPRAAPTVRLTGADNQQQLLTVARTLVQRTRAMADSWQVTCVADASIELGDPLDLSYRSHGAYQLVAGYSFPLGPKGAMSIDCRGLNAGAPEDL